MRSLWHLARPAGAWAAPALPLLGYGWAHWDRAIAAWNLPALPWVLAAWLALQTGTLWLNAARDRDCGEVLFGRTVPVPPHTTTASLIALMLSVMLAMVAHPVAGLCAAGAAVLSLLYSHPRSAWKAHPLGGPVVNVLGYGLLSPAAGYALAETPVTARTLVIAIMMCLTILGWYYAAQAFQQKEDQARGDLTLVAMHGPMVTLRITRVCQGLVAALLVILCLSGWLPRIALATTPLFLWLDRFLALWQRQPNGGNEAWARGLAGRSTAVLIALLAVVALDYTWATISDNPVAGLGTAAGLPYDRNANPPSRQGPLDMTARRTSGVPYAPATVTSVAYPP
ncbi:MAG: 4-hydroxybenzoate polyprenyltransferase [Kiritimatiellia bacterium]|jgi:4-hydroxybenzoate polyprenyltransferase